MQQAIVINDTELAKINAGPVEGRRDARLLLLKQARVSDPHSCDLPLGTEFFNNAELRELFALTGPGRTDLTYLIVDENTPSDLKNLAIAWKSAPTSCIEA
eukprot:7338981-Heterocapsa_arctica.AAC.1